MATSRGRAEVDRFFANLPAEIETKLLRGAGRAGAAVIVEEAKVQSISHDVDEALRIRTKAEPGRVVAKIDLKPGWGRSLGIWAEYGTSPHFISVDDSQRGGRSAARINKLTKEGSLVIGGNFVGTTVHHPGARPHPFLRVALDTKRGEAIAAAQRFIDARVTPGGIVDNGGPLIEDGE